MIGLRRKINSTRNETERYRKCRWMLFIIDKREIKEKMHHQLKREVELFQ